MATRAISLAIATLLAVSATAAEVGNRLQYLDAACDPYWVGREMAKLVTPQWIGEEGVEFAIVLSIDDLRDPIQYEKFLRPVFERLKKIDGRAPVSLMTPRVEPNHPQLQVFLKEGASLEVHTLDHPCPCLQGGDFGKAKRTYDGCVELMRSVPGNRPVAFRMPCCDSMNSASPRFFAEIFNRTTPAGNFLAVDSSVMVLFTANDPALPRGLVQDEDQRARFAKYLPQERKFGNYVEDYPYPYVIDRLCWEVPAAIPDDWLGFNLQGRMNPKTVADMKAALDATAIKQGVFTLVFHPHNWISNEQVVDLVDYAATKYGKKVKFLTLREVYERILAQVTGGVALRAENGQDNGVRVFDVNHDGYMDAVIANEKLRQMRIWSPHDRRWTTGEFPTELVLVDEQGNRRETGARFGVLQKSGRASVCLRSESTAGVWHFEGTKWVADKQGLASLAAANLLTSDGGKDTGVRMVDLDRDGLSELIAAGPKRQAVLRWQPERHAWERLPFTLPDGATFVDDKGRDAGCRLVDLNEDGHLDVVFSSSDRYLVSAFNSMRDGWSRKIRAGRRPDPNEIPMIVRADGTNNGVWFSHRYLWVQNEDTGVDVELGGQKVRIPTERRSYAALLGGDSRPPSRSPEE